MTSESASGAPSVTTPHPSIDFVLDEETRPDPRDLMQDGLWICQKCGPEDSPLLAAYEQRGHVLEHDPDAKTFTLWISQAAYDEAHP